MMTRDELIDVMQRSAFDSHGGSFGKHYLEKFLDDLDTRTCKNCDYAGEDLDGKYLCDKGVIEHWKGINNFDDFGCNKFKEIQDG